MDAIVHDFQESLEWSRQQESAPWWEEVYQKAFPGLAAMVPVPKDGWAQRAGIDRILTLNSGRTVSIDEKVRRKDWPDFALERWSDEARKTPGWIQKPLACDYIAYAFVPSGMCFLFPTLLLQRAWREFGREWVEKYPAVRAQNNGYVTISVPVPREILLDAIRECLVVPFTPEAIAA